MGKTKKRRETTNNPHNRIITYMIAMKGAYFLHNRKSN